MDPLNGEKKLLICYYGDDFTGSTDSMEALTIHGVRTVLFLEVPSAELLKEERFSDIRGIGIAGVGRSMTPQQMEQELSPIFEQMRSFNTPILHYKTCSTFDSSPEIGSIGKAIKVGNRLFPDQRAVPLLVGIPKLKRYTVFGNHFATVGTETFRLDRHPMMMKHPVTPMGEADLRVHLKAQADLKVALMDIFSLEGDVLTSQKNYESLLNENHDVILFDILHNAHLERAGKLIWDESENGQQFVVGSSGVEYALAKHWNNIGLVDEAMNPSDTAGSVEQLLVVSGSCSPATQQQIRWALENGFEDIRASSSELVLNENEMNEEVFRKALNVLNEGKNLIIYTAFGSDDPDIEKTKQLLISKGLHPTDTGKIIGKQLGRLVKELVRTVGLKRVVIAGGDTSGYATSELGIYGLEMIMPLEPGVPLCQCYSIDPTFDGLELILKGGQVGPANFFEKVLNTDSLLKNRF